MKTLATLLAALLIVATPAAVSWAADPPTASQLAGLYGWESGGLRITLVLDATGAYRAKYSGCLGTYGVVKGRWVSRDDLLTLSPEEDSSEMKYPLDAYALSKLRVTVKDGVLLLVRTEDDGEEMTRQLRETDRHHLYEKIFYQKPSH